MLRRGADGPAPFRHGRPLTVIRGRRKPLRTGRRKTSGPSATISVVDLIEIVRATR